MSLSAPRTIVAAQTAFWVAVVLSVACTAGDDDSVPNEAGRPGGDATVAVSVGGAGGIGGMTAVGGGGAGGVGGNTGGGAVDLGWPLDDTLPSRCASNPPAGGSPWDGWGNVQFPAAITVNVGVATESIYGRTYRAGETPNVGQAPGWEAELGVGPLGTLPTPTGRCWSYTAGAFNVDVANNDEYGANWTADEAGLFSFLFRFRPPDGAWRYGDLNGSDDGISVVEAGALTVEDPSPPGGPLVIATLNLRCRLDDWPARRPLVIAALARVNPDLIAFQEDCIEDAGPSQAEEIRAELSTYTRRGYALRRVGTHQATNGNDVYQEGISALSALPIVSDSTLDLPYAQIPRKALAIDLQVGGQSVRFYATHFDFGSGAETVRQQSAAAIVADLPPATFAILAGDLNADPAEPALVTLNDALDDLWVAANPNFPGKTFPSDGPAVRIDYVFASALPAGGLIGAKQLDETDGTAFLSDHFGVVVALTVP